MTGWGEAAPLGRTARWRGRLRLGDEGVLAHPLFRRRPDICAVEDYLAFGYVPDDASMVAGVHKLPAGHFLLIERGRAIPGRANGGTSISRTAKADRWRNWARG
ncbi:hypothetical protein GCM10020258_01650 [Sphingomonas yabuuchiae]